ncbi:GMC oxidoreductase [Acidocella sp.]|uniref:GMC oxidoreductase n=1 Tax=Acidocella sp. TaxID=50710 RepID=UPI00262E1D98|nr:GMC family oxidoreductase [Acidocella sp.]
MNTEPYDVVVVGSGAAGSFAAKELTERGLRVLVLEAGRNVTGEDFKLDPKAPKEKGIQLWARIRAALEGQPIQSKVAFYGRQLKHFFVQDSEHPYTTPRGKPFLWIRGKQLGGRLHTYGRMLLRWTDYDFKAASRDGYGEDWPIGYADIAPYYDRVEEFLGVYGEAREIPNLPAGHYAGDARLTRAEAAFKAKIEQKWPERAVTTWRYVPPNARRIPHALLAAQATGRLTVRTDAVVRRVLTDPRSGKATGVEYADRLSKKTEVATGKVVMLCASPIETVRLMLNSTSPRHPRGIGNSSGTLGHYFMDQVPSLIIGSVPGVEGAEVADPLPADPFYGNSGGVYIPRFENLGQAAGRGFRRGFGFQGTIGRLFVRAGRPAQFGIMGFGEMLPHFENQISLEPRRKDRWGVPLPRIACAITPNEAELLRGQVAAIKDMVEAAGLEIEFYGSQLGLVEQGRGAFPDADWFSRLLFRLNFTKGMAMGAAIHESGGARMGKDPAISVLNAHNQCWDVPNLFVTDASSFATGGCCGTTLTVMALTVRACEYVAGQLAAGRL